MVLKLAVTVFTNLSFQASWLNGHNFFGYEKNSVYVWKTNPDSHSKSPTNNGFFKIAEALLQFHACFVSHSVKLRAFRLSGVTVALPYMPQMSAINGFMRLNTYNYLNSIFEDLLPNYCCIIETNDRTIRRKFCNLPLQAKERPWVITVSSSLHDTRTVNLALVQCEFHTGKKLSMQELNQFIGIKLLTSYFLETFDS